MICTILYLESGLYIAQCSVLHGLVLATWLGNRRMKTWQTDRREEKLVVRELWWLWWGAERLLSNPEMPGLHWVWRQEWWLGLIAEREVQVVNTREKVAVGDTDLSISSGVPQRSWHFSKPSPLGMALLFPWVLGTEVFVMTWDSTHSPQPSLALNFWFSELYLLSAGITSGFIAFF